MEGGFQVNIRVQVPLDTLVDVRAESFRGVLDKQDAETYRALQESTEEYPEAEVPPQRRPRLTEAGRSLVAVARGRDRAQRVSASPWSFWEVSGARWTRPRQY